ncbi:MAG TPA: MFS transporter [Bryobacteraceae bacterium]|nr:MFS transporter [Bryobacteraceae bacterium]
MKIASAWPVVGLLWVAFLINYIDRQAVFSIYPALKSDLHFSNAQLGLIGTIFIWTYSLCMTPAGWLADIFRRDRLVIASLVLWSAATLGTGLSYSIPAFLFWRVAVGITEAIYIPAALGLIAALHSSRTRSRALAVHSTAQYAGIMAGGWYGGWMADRFGWRLGFGMLALAGCAYAFLLWRILSEVKAQPASTRSGAPSSPLEVFRSRSYLAMCLGFFAFCTMLWMLYAWLPSFIYDRYHLSMAESGLAGTLYLQASSLVGVLIGGALADAAVKRVRAARFYVAGAGLLLSAPFAYMTLATHSLLALKLAATVFGLTAGLLMSNQFAASYDVTAERNYGFGAGTLNMVGGLSGGAGILAAGLWSASVGIARLMFWAAVGTVLSACIVLATAAKCFSADRRRAGLPE